MLTAQREPIFHLGSLARSLDDAHPEKELFLALVNLARAQLNIIVARTQSQTRTRNRQARPTTDALASTFSKGLFAILESRWYVYL